MIGLPHSDCSPLHLPFNRHSLAVGLRLETPDRDPGEPGCWLLLQGSRLWLADSRHGPSLPTGKPPCAGTESALYIGAWQGRPCRLLQLASDAAPPAGLTAVRYTDDEPQLAIDLLSLAGLGRMIGHWESNNRFCSTCGAPLQRLPGEWGKTCSSCRVHHFPHIHPCAIVLVQRPGEVLLTRKAGWAPNRYSLVAGFVEMGECLEEAAAREVAEETGIAINSLRYLGSQCWPFPAQLMCGFVAEYAGGELRIDANELEDARWFAIDRLPALPPKRSIARYILDTALELP
ncbi:MAG: NAD(+) diphosphatase [Desulfuromonadales bacterium]|nr:NAD(+) diphosphatase [Desulfuromonadales bacterium]